MNLSELNSIAEKAARTHEELVRRVKKGAGKPGISRLRFQLEQASLDRLVAEKKAAVAQEAMSE